MFICLEIIRLLSQYFSANASYPFFHSFFHSVECLTTPYCVTYSLKLVHNFLLNFALISGHLLVESIKVAVETLTRAVDFIKWLRLFVRNCVTDLHGNVYRSD